MAAVMRQGVVVPGPGMPPRLSVVPSAPEPVDQTVSTSDAVDAAGIQYYPSFQPGYRLVDGSDLIDLTGRIFGPNGVASGSILNFGGSGNGFTDNTQALLLALNSGLTSIIFPPGVYVFAAGVNFTLPYVGTGTIGNGISITGAGSDATVILCQGAGWTFNMSSPYDGISISNMSFVTSQAGTATALTFNGTFSSPAGQPGLAMSNLENLAFYGANGPGGASLYWHLAVNIVNVSNFNFTNVIVVGVGMPSAANPFVGAGVQLSGSATAIAIAFNFVNCAFNMLAIGIQYNTDVQGVTVANSNFTCNTGIYIPTGGVNTYQLSVTNSQIGCVPNNAVGINAPLGNLTDIMIVGTTFVCAGQNTIGISLVRSNAVVIVGNVFELQPTTTGVILSQAYPGDPYQYATVSGNTFHSTSGSGGSAIQTATPQEVVLGLNCFDPRLAVGIFGASNGDVGMTIQVLEAGVWTNVKVIAGPADSGGTGYRTLIIPN